MRRIVSIVCIVLGLSLLCYPIIDKQLSERKQRQLVEAFEILGQIDTLDNTSDSTSNSTSDNGVSEELDSDSSTVEDNETKEEQSTLLKGARGIIRIPSIDLEMIIYNGADAESLDKGIGMIEPKKKFGQNNVGLAGHRSTTYGKRFNRLGEIEIQDRIEIQDARATYQFEVVEIKTVHQTEVDVLEDEEEPLLTLVTCTPVGKKNPTHRLIVQGRFIDMSQ